MTTKLFNTLYDEVLSDVPGVIPAVALNAIRNAAIELCERSKVWVVTHTPISSVATQAAYAFAPDAGTVVSGIVQAWYNGVLITPMTAAQLDAELSVTSSGESVTGTPWTEQTGVPEYYLMERSDEFILAPYPSEAVTDGIKLRVALKPARDATGMEQWIMDDYFLELAHGAKANLFAMHSKPWSSADQAVFHRHLFEVGINKASFLTNNSRTLPAMVSSPSPV